MNELDSDSHLLLLENHIGEVEARLNMLRDQIVAMFGEDDEIGTQSDLLGSTHRAMRCLQLLRLEIRDDMGQPATGGSVL